jgi:hypothetical protein
MIRLWAGRLGNWVSTCWERGAVKASVFFSALDRLWHTLSTCSVDARAVFLGIKRPVREAYYSLASSGEEIM